MAVMREILFMVTIAVAYCSIEKRVLPTNEHCDPDFQTCRKGDWIDKNIADCEYRKELFHYVTCDAKTDQWGSWIVDLAKGDRCKPVKKRKVFTCGSPGSNTRCVCSDVNLNRQSNGELANHCRCQYWPTQDIGASQPAFCTGYYTGGEIAIHHWACCNNCNDLDTSCAGSTWQGGSSGDYCQRCGQQTATAGGREKYFFNCGGCTEQEACATRCTEAGYNFPLLCWKWLDCFKGCCLRMTAQPRSKRQATNAMTTAFCGDGSCDGSEKPSSCPIDCCHQVNSNCTIGASCTPSCCGSPDCCLHVGEVGGSATVANGMFSLVIMAVLMTMYIVI